MPKKLADLGKKMLFGIEKSWYFDKFLVFLKDF